MGCVTNSFRCFKAILCDEIEKEAVFICNHKRIESRKIVEYVILGFFFMKMITQVGRYITTRRKGCRFTDKNLITVFVFNCLIDDNNFNFFLCSDLFLQSLWGWLTNNDFVCKFLMTLLFILHRNYQLKVRIKTFSLPP